MPEPFILQISSNQKEEIPISCSTQSKTVFRQLFLSPSYKHRFQSVLNKFREIKRSFKEDKSSYLFSFIMCVWKSLRIEKQKFSPIYHSVG